MKLPKDWKDIRVPLSLTAALVFALASAFLYVNNAFVHAEDFKQQVRTLELRGLERDKAMLEREVLKLEVKRNAYPAKFDAVDKALLEKQQQDLKEVKEEINQVKKATK